MLEDQIFSALKGLLSDQKFLKVFAEEYEEAVKNLIQQQGAQNSSLTHKIKQSEQAIRRIIEAVKDGMNTPAMRDELHSLTADNDKWQRELSELKMDPARLPAPDLPRLYKRLINDLGVIFGNLDDTADQRKALEPIRGLITAVIVTPELDGKNHQIEFQGSLANILNLASQSKNSGITSMMVAGVGFEPTIFRL